MKRVISLYLPHLPTDRVRKKLASVLPANKPLILIGKDRQKQAVTASDVFAQRLGITPGMPATQARAMVSDLHIEDADPHGDADSLEQLALWALRRYSPMVAMDFDGLWIDATGCTHLFGGKRPMLTDMVSKLNDAGIDARAAIAATYGGAYAITHSRQTSITVITPKECLVKTLGNLPVRSLRLSEATVKGLTKLGIETVSELKEKPRKSLVLRFGKEVGLRLDQALGFAGEVMSPVIPSELISEKRIFGEPIASPESIAGCIGILTDAICRRLENKGLGARCLDLFCHRVDNEIKVIRINLAQPRRDAKRLTRLLCDKIEKLDPGYGLEIMNLTAPWIEPVILHQMITDQGTKAVADIASLVDTLGNRIGHDHIYRFVPVESDVPERSIARSPALAEKPALDWPFRWPRPVRLFPRPEPIETIAMLPDYPPVSFTWRGVRHKVRAADGPERIFGEWWKRDAELEAVRDYFRLEDEDGSRFWVFRAGDGVLPGSGSQKWFMHGLFG